MGKSSGETETSVELPGLVTSPLTKLIARLGGFPGFRGAFDQPREVLPTDFIPLDPTQERALGGIESLATAGSPFQASSEAALLNLLSPDPNIFQSPQFAQQLQGAVANVVPQIRDQFNVGGGAGGLESEALGRGVGLAAGQIAANQFNADRAAQINALGLVPGFNAERFSDLQRLLSVGDVRRGVEREQLTADVGRQEEERQRLTELTGVLAPLLGIGAGGATTTQRSEPGFSPVGTGVGLGLLGLGLFGPGAPFALGGGAASTVAPTLSTGFGRRFTPPNVLGAFR